MSLAEITIEWEVFASEGSTGIGGIRAVHPKHLLVHFENYGEANITADQIAAAHDGKVILNLKALPQDLLTAIGHAHDGEAKE
ncbi:MAG: hypothetical protein AAFY38_12280 [Pseudomonadota bacterium]